MITAFEAKEVDGISSPRHEVQVVCTACGYDLDESELAADTCADCGATLSLTQHMRIYATSVPPAQGITLV